MSAEAMTTHSWQVGPWTVTLTMPPLVRGAVRHCMADWTPCLPDRPFTPDEQRQYDEGLAVAMVASMESMR